MTAAEIYLDALKRCAEPSPKQKRKDQRANSMATKLVGGCLLYQLDKHRKPFPNC